MSGFVGLWNLNGQPVDRRLLERMTDAIAHRGPDGAGYWVNRSVGLGHRMLHTTPESLHETQPFLDESTVVCLAFDGRIDNREVLAAQLKGKGIVLRTDTDAELVLRTYECWGPDCPRHLLGDFAFVIWDGRNRQLFCARDPLGSKPFYYYRDNRIFLCASELVSILEHPAIGREVNEGMLGEYLASQITSHKETLYRGVLRLPPAHFLLVKPESLWKERYWDIDPARSISYKNDQDYADHFRELLSGSVRCRLRSHRPVGSYLSGGLDSSSIVGMAQSLVREGKVTGPGLETFSLIFPGSPCDESTYIQDVVQMWGLSSHTVRPEVQGRAFFAECVRQDRDFPGYPNGTMGNSLRALAQDKGFSVLLTGTGGDEWLAGSLHHAADLLRRLRIVPMLRRVGPDTGTSGLREIACAAVQFGIGPLLPPLLRRTLKRILRRDGVPSWVNPDFARRINLAERLQASTHDRGFPSFAQADIYDLLRSGWWPHTAEVEERAASRFGLEERHPLSDQRIVEFALAIPEDQRWRGEQPKFILRQAMRGLLPESVRQRLTKAEFSPVLQQTFDSLGGSHFFDSLQLSARGWIDGTQVRRVYDRMMDHDPMIQESPPPGMWPLWMIAGSELWLKHAGVGQGVSSSAAPSHLEAAAQPA
jgi:asparagine synthase (glutamine-hydrolysing)